ncbi:hypothetical protein GCM10009779_00150 [Polymorphospora rubra]|uniref:Uncharacterized protein n=2 Tax=Polymorphospora rubra TaxID=338584 RepID=A0A810N5A5_9ACTN|nr:hypothetical protein Prubr_57130 [Polymorphospora rubra]
MLGLGSAAQAAASIFNTRAQIAAAAQARTAQHRFERAQAADRFGHERQLEAVRELRQRDLAELEARLRRENTLLAIRDKTVFDTYPLEEGPGHLRQSLSLLSPDLSALPLVVLLPRFHGTPEPHWAGLRQAVADALRRQLSADGLVLLYDAMRPLSWPHAGFYWNDLYGIPTMIVQVAFARDTLDVSLGGCHLRPRSDAPAEPMRSVYRHRLARPGHWTEETIAELNASVPAGYRLAMPETEADRVGVNIEVAARSVTAVATAAVDAYYLGNRARYRQRFDGSVAMLGRAALPEWPYDLGVAIDQVVDPAFHLLHVAARQLDRGRSDLALATVRESLAVLVHPDYALVGAPYPGLSQSAAAVAGTDDEYRARLAALLDAIAARAAEDGADKLAAEVAEITTAVRDA